MAKNGQNDLIFGKLVISNDFKRLMEVFLKILIFGQNMGLRTFKMLTPGAKSSKIRDFSKFVKVP